jgi:hypothetical protein
MSIFSNKNKKNGLLCVAVLGVLCTGLLPAAQATVTAEPATRSACIYDPLGANGPIFQNFKTYQAQALQWGVKLELKPYTSERIAAEDFKSGACQAAVLTGLLGRQFNSFTGTIDAYGALPDYAELKTTFAKLSAPAVANYMQQGNYEVVGLMPGGAAYLFVDDRSIDTPQELSGKRFAFLDSDPGLKQLVMKIGASPVNSTINTMYSQFNNGAVDVVFGPAMVYDAMELHKGLSPKGGVVRYPTGQLTIQMVILQSAFPQGYGQKSRDFVMQNFDQALQSITQYEQSIPSGLWIDLPASVQADFGEILRQARITLRDQSIYDAKMLTVMRKVRCGAKPDSAECSATDRE